MRSNEAMLRRTTNLLHHTNDMIANQCFSCTRCPTEPTSYLGYIDWGYPCTT